MLLHKSLKPLLFGEGMQMGTPSRKQSCCERKGTSSGLFGERSTKSSVEMSAIQAARTSTSKMKNNSNKKTYKTKTQRNRLI